MQKLKTIKLKKWITLVAIVASVFLLISIGLFFGLRNYFLNQAILKVKDKVKAKYEVSLEVNNASFTELAAVELNGINLIPLSGDTIISVNKFAVSLKPLYLLLGDIRIKNVNIDDGFFSVIKKGDYNNLQSILNAEKKDSNAVSDENQTDEKVNYAEKAYKLIVKILNKVPNRVFVKNFELRLVDDERYVLFNLKQFVLADNILNSVTNVKTEFIDQNWIVGGYANPKKQKADISLTTDDTSRVLIPYLIQRFNLRAGFDSVRLVLNSINFDDDELKIEGYAAIKNLLVNHPKVALTDVIVNTAELNYTYLIGADYISLDSSSTVNFNNIRFNPFVKYQRGVEPTYWLSVQTETTTAQNFINALPIGLFENIRGMEAEGDFSYRLDFMLNEANPDAMVFESNLTKENLRITKYGNANLAKLNSEFYHTPIENGRPVRQLDISENNPYFTPVADVSEFLKKAVLTSEDPSFFYHRGFVTEAFRQSIVKNIKTGKFKRGASTISMQLMKNVFLTREKTMARKLEEILLVYILENNYIVPKERMFEVYLNIIEWGPNVYGIGEACKFYFNKRPNELTLSESLFLSTIIPSPKKFMWRFDANGNARNWLERSFQFLATKMVTRQLILPDDTIGLTHLVNITGAARKFIVKNDSLLNDSIIEIDLLQKDDD